MVTLRQLELLIAMSEHKGMSAGGVRLGMSPSATSHALRALETQLRVAVVDRQARSFRLTDAGLAVLRHAKDIFVSLETIQQEGRAAAELKTGVLRVGSFGASSSVRILPALLERFRTLHPGIEVMVFEEPDRAVEQALTEGRIDFGVVALPKPQFDTLTLATDELMAVLPENHPLAANESVDLRDLVRYPFIMTHAGSQDLIQRLFERSGAMPRVTHELSQIWSIMDFVRRGQGVSIVAALALPDAFPGIVARPVLPRSHRHVGLACRDERRLSHVGQALWRMARQRAIGTR